MSEEIAAERPTTVARTILCILSLAGLALAPAGASAGPVEEARKLLKAKQYDRIDAVLKKQLESATPSAEALRISLAAAVARGRVITAQQRIMALLRITAKADLDLVYQGGMISEQIGERRMALSRYVIYATKQTVKDDRMRHALEYLVTKGKFPAQYKKYVTAYGPSGRAWNMGMALVRRLVVDQEPAMALDVAAFMMESFRPDPRQTYQFHGYFMQASDRGHLGTDERRRYILPLQIMARRCPSGYGQLARMCNLAHRYLSAREAADVLLEMHTAADGPVDQRCLVLLDRLRYTREGSERLALPRRVYSKLEPLYRKSTAKGVYAAFLDSLCRYRDSFITRDDTVFDEKTLAAMLDAAAKKGATSQVDLVLERLCQSDRALQTALARKYAGAIGPDRAAWVIGPLSGKGDERAAQIKAAKPFVEAFRKGRDVRGRVLAGASLLEWYNHTGDKDALLSAARDYMAAFPGSFNWNTIWQHVWSSKLPTLAEKLALLQEHHAKSGPSGPLDQIVLNRLSRDTALRKDPGVQALVRGYRRKGSDPVMRVAVSARGPAGGRKKSSPERLLTELLSGYKGPLPAGRSEAQSVNDVALVDTLVTLLQQMQRFDQVARSGLADRLPPGPLLAGVLSRAVTFNAHGLAAKIAPKLKGDDAATKKIWWALSFARNPKGDTTSLMAPYYGRMGWDNAVRYLIGQMGSWHQRSWRSQPPGKTNWPRETFLAELEKLAAVPEFAIGDAQLQEWVQGIILQRPGKGAPQAKPSKKLADVLWRSYLARAKGDGVYQPTTEAALYTIHRRMGQAQAQGWLDDYSKVVAARSPGDRVIAISVVMRAVGRPRVPPDRGRGAYLRLFALAAAAYEKMPDAQWKSVGVLDETRWAAGMLANNAPWRAALKGNPLMLETGQRLAAMFDTRLLAGARWSGGGNPVPSLCEQAIKAAAEKRDWPAAIAATRRLAEALDGGRTGDEHKGAIVASAKALAEVGANEILYAFLRQVEQQARLSSVMGKEIAILRARAARGISGLISVSANDPAYPLHLAAQALLLGNDARAWELSRDQLQLFGRSWEGLDADFVAWYVRQLCKQKLYDEVIRLAGGILKKESALDAETAAAIHLAIGDVRRGQENNEAAVAIYMALQASNRYKDTRAGVQARYRHVLLMIAMGAYAEAEDVLARMVEAPSIDEQAEAYYLLAKLADEQKEYRKADKYLTKALARVPDHIEAAFLEGELRAKAPSMLARGEVLEIGVVAMETVAVPGRELIFRLQDSNLAIAKGSTSIPVTVETSTGKDRETVDMVLSGTGKNLFKGTIATRLGKVVPGDRMLQVRGNDIVSYRIADEFQKSHEISYPAKDLVVKADGELSASAGRILTAREIEKREIERKLALARGEKPPAWATERRKSVRPGSPVYVRVRDLDRDVSQKPDTVIISVKTSSGDVLNSVALTETGANTGVFLGKIPTSLPLPKGLASDTFEGKQPAWLINSTGKDVWSSVDDGAKPKWVEADTMTSHLVKSVSVELPDAGKITSLSLSGRLAGDEDVLATYPLLPQQHGLRRELFAAADLTKPTGERTVTSASIRGELLGKGNVAARLSGFITPAYSEEYTFSVSIKSARARLRIADKPHGPLGGLLVDQWPAKGSVNKNVSVKMKLQAGWEYRFELAFAGTDQADRVGGDCSVTWRSRSQQSQEIPVEAMYPGGVASRMDDLKLTRTTAAPTRDHPLTTLKAILARVKTGDKAAGRYVKATSVAPAAADEVGVLEGAFSVPAERMLAMRLTGENVGRDSRAYLLVDGRQEIGGKLSDLKDKAVSVFLRQGAHRMQLVYRSAGPARGSAKIGVACRDKKEQFAAMPWQWFSADHTPDLADAILPNGLIAVRGNTFTAVLRKPIRLRTVRWNFLDYTGKDVAVKKITVTDADGKKVIPVEKDFTSSLTNDMLEIAPGDSISMTYVDEKNLQGEASARKAGMSLGRGATLSVGFDDGTIVLAHEETVTDSQGRKNIELFPARRCSVGDVLTVVVSDEDIDQTPARDKIRITLATSSGRKLDLNVLEKQSVDSKGQVHDVCHTGQFVMKIRLTGAAAKAKPAKPAPKPAKAGAAATTAPATAPAMPSIIVAPGDEIVARYLDVENNDGVPIDRISRLTEGGAGFGGWSVKRTRTQLVEDTSPEAVILRNDLQRISGDPDIEVYRQVVLHLSPKVKADEGDEEPTIDRGLDENGSPVCSVRGPLKFSLLYPRLARNTGSTVRVAAVAESEIKAAKAEGRKTKGAYVTMSIPDEDELEAGRFYGTVDFQIGVPGDKLDLEAQPGAGTDGAPVVKTIIVRGDDVVQLRFSDPDGAKTRVERVRLLADGRMEVLERTLRARKLKIHLGQKFYVRVADPDRDTTNARDTVRVGVKSSSGHAVDLKLTETLAHSGIFTGSVEPRWIKDRARDEAARKAAAKRAAAAPKPAPATRPATAPATRTAKAPPEPPAVLYANFGDTVAFRHVDAKAVSSREGLILQVEGSIVHGSNADVALFSKRYKDPEIAVKTSFLTAEAMFNMAKGLRKKGQKALADEYITRGKAILERALRDYPNTTLVAQGEFLVATLAQELGNYSEAIGKYSEIVQRWIKSPYAPKALYRIGQCYEAQKNFDRASEEYVRVTYLFPKSPEVTQATLRLGRHYLNEKNHAVAGRIFEKFHENNPKHRLAARTLFLAGECYRLSEKYPEAIRVFSRAAKAYPDNVLIRSESLYWKGICARQIEDYVTAYRSLKRLTWDYPESKRAADARKLLGGDEFQFEQDDEDSSK